MKTDRPTEEARKLANEYLVEWCSNYQKHGDLAQTDWDGSLAEYHLANFLTRNTAGLRALVGEQSDLLRALREFMNRRFDRDRLLHYQQHFIREIDSLLARAEEATKP